MADQQKDTVTFFKKRRAQHVLKEKTAKEQSFRAKNKNVKAPRFLRPDNFLKVNLKKAKEERRMNRLKRHDIKLKAPEEKKVYLVIRDKTIAEPPSACRKAFQQLRLERVNTAVFVRANKENLKKIQLIQPYVTYGEPSLASIKSLIFKRGFTLNKSKRVALNNNVLVEEKLGKLGLICIEDLIHEISTVGDHFNKVINFLEPFEFFIPKRDPALNRIQSTVMDRTTEEEKANLVNELVAKLN